VTSVLAGPETPSSPCYVAAGVVLIDEASDFRWMVRRALERTGLYTVLAEAADGLVGVEAVMDHAPDLVLLDIDLPGADGTGGLDALALILRHRPATRVVMLTAMAPGARLDAALLGGAIGIIRKGSSLTNMIAQLRWLVGADSHHGVEIEGVD
jgi:two-component system response regulator DesR